MKRAVWLFALVGVLLCSIRPLALHAQELILAPAAEGRRLLGTRDDFVERLSPFDRAARVRTDRNVDEAEYLRFAASAAQDWSTEESAAVAAAYRAIEPRLAQLRLPLPARVLVIKTSGREEGTAAYTRGNAIILPHVIIESSAPLDLQKLLAHELFHIASRANPKLAAAAYAAIGFHYCGEAVFPAELASRKITNPDAPRNDYCIGVKIAGEDVTTTPILYSRTATYDSVQGGEFFDYLRLGMLVRAEASAGAAAAAAGTSPRVVETGDITGFFEQVGKNTSYIIHPEEILADNFSLLVTNPVSVASPEVLAKLERVLADHGP